MAHIDLLVYNTCMKIAAAFSFLMAFITCTAGAVERPSASWEHKNNAYYLAKNSRASFSSQGAGANLFTDKYLSVNGMDFLVRGENDWKDYGRLNLEGNNVFKVPFTPGMKIEAVHLLAGGNYGNSYEHDPALKLYGDNYYYGVITATFIYEAGAYEQRSVPVFWDWFHLNTASWSKDGTAIRYAGANPARKDCSMAQIIFNNPRPAEPLKDIVISDSWLSDRPFSDIFGLTLVSADSMDAAERKDLHFKPQMRVAASEPADNSTFWGFNRDLDGWISGCSENWTAETSWHAKEYGREGVIAIPACNWGGDKYSWIEKKVALPRAKSLQLQFWRHSALISEPSRQWSDGLLKITLKPVSGNTATVYEKIYNGEWNKESADISLWQGQTVIIRLENHGAGSVQMSDTSSSACDAEDALIDHIQVTGQ